MAELINKHGRRVAVQDHRVDELLARGFRHPDDRDRDREEFAKKAAEAGAKLHQVLTENSHRAGKTATANADVIEFAIAEPKKANLEAALVAIGLDPKDFQTNDDRLDALNKHMATSSTTKAVESAE